MNIKYKFFFLFSKYEKFIFYFFLAEENNLLVYDMHEFFSEDLNIYKNYI